MEDRLGDAYGGRIKLGLDIHGVIDQCPEFFSMLTETDFFDFEVHIITGIKEELDDIVDKDKIKYTKWFSIHQQCLDEGIEVTLDDKGRPWVDPEIWDRKKAEYCEREGIHMMIDDSPSYGKYFKDLECLYLRLENTNRDNWRKDGQHKDSPVDEDDLTISYTIPGWVIRTGRVIKRSTNAIVNALKKPATVIRRKLRVARIMPSRLYPYDKNVDDAVIHMIENCEYQHSTAYDAVFIDPKTNTRYTAWINNKMYGYASHGCRDGQRIWDNLQPSRDTCIRLLDIVEKKNGGSLIK